MAELTKEQYMKSLSWDMDKYALLTKDEVAPLMEKNGTEMYTFSVKDPKGVKAFGKGAKVVNKEWAEGMIPGITSGGKKQEATEPASVPPPPPAPKKQAVPENIQKVADASENVTIASVPKAEEKKEEPKEYPKFVHTRANNLVQNHGFKFEKGFFVRGELKLSHDDLEEMENDEWTEMIKVEEKPEPKPKVEKDKDFIEELQKPVPPAEDIDDVNVEEDDVEDLQGEVVDATTIRTEAPKSVAKDLASDPDSNITEKMTTGNTGGFFSSLSKLGFQQLNLSVNKLEDDKLNVIVKPQNFSGDPAFDEIRPLNITGTAQELEEGFFEAVGRPLQKVAGMMTNAKTFLDDLAEQEKKTKAAEAKQKKVKDLVDKAKKYHDDKDFDPSKTVSFNTATKKWQAVLELDPENKDAKEGMEKLKEYKAKNGETLDLQ